MEQDDQDRCEYPDPDYAAYVTKYPWFGEEHDSVLPGLPSEPDGAWPNGFDDQPTARASQNRPLAGGGETAFDPDYEASDDGAP